MKYYIIDAFTDEVFKGNPAGVCLLDEEISDNVMQKIAFENNLAETAFLLKKNDVYFLRWFTPEVEIDLCGHATLATAFVIMNYVDNKLFHIDFQTKSGRLSVDRENDIYKMDFPCRKPVEVTIDEHLAVALGCNIIKTYLSRDLLVIVENADTVKNLNVNIDLLSKISKEISFAVIVSAKGDDCDFVSRFFAPNAGIPEDPVTGSSHSTLIPFWSEKLGKKTMVARQLSPRGGTLFCQHNGDRVYISGKAICYLTGDIRL